MVNRIIRNKITARNLLGIVLGIEISIIFMIFGALFEFLKYGHTWPQLYAVAAFGLPILVVMLSISIFRMIYWPANPVYKCWNVYGKSDKIVNEVESILRRERNYEFSVAKQISGFRSKYTLIIHKGWLIVPKWLIFVRTKDINWTYVDSSVDKNSDKIRYNDVFIHTVYGFKFHIEGTSIWPNSEQNVKTQKKYMDQLSGGMEVDSGKQLFGIIDVPFAKRKFVIKSEKPFYASSTNLTMTYLNIFNDCFDRCIFGWNKKYEKMWKTSPKNFNEKIY